MRGNESGTAEVARAFVSHGGTKAFFISGGEEKMDRAETLAWLDGLGINYRLATHPAVHTIQAMEELGSGGQRMGGEKPVPAG